MRTENLIPTLPDTEKIRLERGRQRYTKNTDIDPRSFILRESELIAFLNEYSEGKPAYILLRACDIERTYLKAKKAGELTEFLHGLKLSLAYVEGIHDGKIAQVWQEKAKQFLSDEEIPAKKREVNTEKSEVAPVIKRVDHNSIFLILHEIGYAEALESGTYKYQVMGKSKTQAGYILGFAIDRLLTIVSNKPELKIEIDSKKDIAAPFCRRSERGFSESIERPALQDMERVYSLSEVIKQRIESEIEKRL